MYGHTMQKGVKSELTKESVTSYTVKLSSLAVSLMCTPFPFDAGRGIEPRIYALRPRQKEAVSCTSML